MKKVIIIFSMLMLVVFLMATAETKISNILNITRLETESRYEYEQDFAPEVVSSAELFYLQTNNSISKKSENFFTATATAVSIHHIKNTIFYYETDDRASLKNLLLNDRKSKYEIHTRGSVLKLPSTSSYVY